MQPRTRLNRLHDLQAISALALGLIVLLALLCVSQGPWLRTAGTLAVTALWPGLVFAFSSARLALPQGARWLVCAAWLTAVLNLGGVVVSIGYLCGGDPWTIGAAHSRWDDLMAVVPAALIALQLLVCWQLLRRARSGPRLVIGLLLAATLAALSAFLLESQHRDDPRAMITSVLAVVFAGPVLLLAIGYGLPAVVGQKITTPFTPRQRWRWPAGVGLVLLLLLPASLALADLAKRYRDAGRLVLGTWSGIGSSGRQLVRFSDDGRMQISRPDHPDAPARVGDWWIRLGPFSEEPALQAAVGDGGDIDFWGWLDDSRQEMRLVGDGAITLQRTTLATDSRSAD